MKLIWRFNLEYNLIVWQLFLISSIQSIQLPKDEENQSQSQKVNNIIFDLPDLKTSYKKDGVGIEFELEAFKSTLNDNIIQRKEISKYGELNWLSIGYPRLKLQSIGNNNTQIFIFTSEGFTASVEMLTDELRDVFKEVVKERYNITMKSKQIVNIEPSRFACKITFYDDDEHKILINGKVNHFNRNPLMLDFDARKKSKERILFERLLANGTESVLHDLEISCEISSQGTRKRKNTLTINGDQFDNLGVMEGLFGEGQEKYVTRNQMSTLASQVYQSLNIVEDYEIPESTFAESFIEDIISQTASSVYRQVPIDEALAQLSSYNLNADISPNTIKRELSKVFYVNKTATHDVLVMNQSQFNKLSTSSSSNGNGGGSGGISVFGLFKIGGGGSGSSSSNSASEKIGDDKLFNKQIRDLNTDSQSDIQWERQGDIIVPKSIRVAKLGKSNFSKILRFSRIKSEYTEAKYRRSFALSIFDVHHQVKHVKGEILAQPNKNNLQIENIKDELAQLREKIVNLNKQLEENRIKWGKNAIEIESIKSNNPRNGGVINYNEGEALTGNTWTPTGKPTFRKCYSMIYKSGVYLEKTVVIDASLTPSYVSQVISINGVVLNSLNQYVPLEYINSPYHIHAYISTKGLILSASNIAVSGYALIVEYTK